MDLLSILPNFSIKPYAHILPPLERSRITTVDLISLDTLEIAKRAHVPPADVRRLANHLIKALHHDVGFEEIPRVEQSEPDSSVDLDVPLIPGPQTRLDLSHWCVISTLDPALDTLLDGGIPTGYVTEVTGESGSGKTQFLLGLLLAVQLPPPRGAAKSAIYISTEAPLATNRLSQLIESHPYLSSLARDDAPSLEKVLSINAMDLESQDHILNYQLPVAIKRYNVGLVVLDSITSNYRAEHTSHDLSGLSTRSGELAKLGQMLRNLAANEDIAIVVANQVSDRFEGDVPTSFPRVARDRTRMSSPSQYQRDPIDRDLGAASPLPRQRPPELNNNESYQNTLAIPQSTPNIPSSSPLPLTQDDSQAQAQPDGSYLVGNPVRNEILSLQHQQRFFTGWGDRPTTSSVYPFRPPTLKTPTLGLVWSTQIACRIALKKHERSLDISAEEYPLPSRAQMSSKEENNEANERLGQTLENGRPSAAPVDVENQRYMHKSPSTLKTMVTPSQTQPIEQTAQRSMKLVFSPWAGKGGLSQLQDEVEFEIWKGGMRAVSNNVT
ncbi:P-loop containing nucleoside triphosphate hydrolase protein [Aspergillus pseudodeflectus]|uniref:P-loop containing nucleoside triphosphate hydrolase protein n=1 Tax=Aspergillus pseudodeflectus TaxID=176178 RepID=A0ABR4JYN7_9EURO